MRTLAAEARCIPEQTNNDEGRAADLQIIQREPFTPRAGLPLPKPEESRILVNLHDNGFAFDDSPHEDMAVK